MPLSAIASIARVPLRGPRVVLRPWRASDREPFASLNADPLAMEHLPRTLTPSESEAVARHIEAHFDAHGFGLWALELPGERAFAGLVGLSVPAFDAPFTPCVQVAWHLAREYWGKGYGVEAAGVALRVAFGALRLAEVVACVVPANLRSQRLMVRLGMRHDPADDFDHPLLAWGHPQRRHRLYRITDAVWRATADARPGAPLGVT